ncbi:MAG: uracil-DNA glycosylase, partial [Commensalibacter sp.]|nr:uracil-DNA glycosylase [Commensalibacter sp.]
MQSVFLAHEVDFQGWRNATRRLISDQISPDSIQWHIQPPKDLFTRPYTESTSDKNENLPAFKITRRVFELCQTVIQANEPERFDLLYRWITLCQNHADPFNDKTHHALIHRIERLVQAVQAETSR